MIRAAGRSVLAWSRTAKLRRATEPRSDEPEPDPRTPNSIAQAVGGEALQLLPSVG